MHMRRIENADGTRLHAVSEGPAGAPTILFAHSVGCDLRLWDAQAAALRDRYQVIRYDARGHGASDAPCGAYQVEALGADAIAILDAFGVDRVHFCGLSLGGTVGMSLALNAPGRLASLTLADSAARLGTAEGWQSRIDAVLSSGTASIAQFSMTRFFSDTFRGRDPATVERFRLRLEHTADNGFAGCCAVLRDCDFRARLGEIRLPTLVVCGECDVPTPPTDSRELAAEIADASLVILPGAGHISAVEDPAGFNAALETLLRRAGASV